MIEMWQPIAALTLLFLLNILAQSLVQSWVIRREFRRREEEVKYIGVKEAIDIVAKKLVEDLRVKPAPVWDACPTCHSNMKTMRGPSLAAGPPVLCSDPWHSERVW